MINNWLDHCRLNHQDCPKEELKPTPLPTRVLDVKEDGSDPSLFITNSRMGQYLALSHCWGTSKSLVTTTKNLQNHIACVPMVDLPRNFQDAVIVTRRLGFRYLWVDSLCILQDSESDWLQESVNMGSVYARASCTIAASSAVDSSKGFLLPKDPLEISAYQWTVPSIASESTSVIQAWHINSPASITYEDSGFEKGIRSVPLHHRAWVLQERILSRRTLHFVQNQVLWECASRASTEFDYIQAETLHGSSLGFTTYLASGDYGQRNNHITSEEFLSHASSYLDWYDIIMDYTSRSLTYRKDRLPAIWALAQDMQTRTQGTYIGGLWREELAYGLLFRRRTPSPNSTTPSPDAPSWSWASLDSPVMWTDFASKFTPVVDVVDVKVLGRKEMGRAQRTAIHLNACIGTVTTVSPNTRIDHPLHAVTAPQRLLIDPSDPEQEPVGFAWFDHELKEFEKPLEATCLQLGHRPPRGLMALGLLVAPNDSAEGNEYRRIGYYERFFDASRPGSRLIDTALKREVVLV